MTNTKTFTFQVPGPIVGYRRPKDRGSNYKRYKRFKNDVLAWAMEAGFRPVKPMRKDRTRWSLSVFVYWEGAARSDYSNAYKAIEDSLFEFDRYVIPGPECGVVWDAGGDGDRVVVTVSESVIS